MNQTSGKLTRPDWIPPSLWKEASYKIWKVMRDTWKFFYRSDILHKIYFYLARRVNSDGVITGYTVYPPYANKGAIVRIDYRESSGARYALEISINADKQVIGYRYDLSENEK